MSLRKLPAVVFIVVAAGILFWLRYNGFDSDAAIFGIMGNDILKYGYLPTYMYGQNYFFSLSPYLYAALKFFLAPFFADIIILKLTGLIFSFSGFWMTYLALMNVQENSGRPRLYAGVIFVILNLSIPANVMSIGALANSAEYMFTAGAAIYILSVFEKLFSEECAIPPRLWFAFGLLIAYGYVARPNAVIFAVFGMALLIVRYGKAICAKPGLSIFSFASGAILGFAPIILHHLFRAAHWPFTVNPPRIYLASSVEIKKAASIFYYQIIPHLFNLEKTAPVYSFVVVIFIFASLAAYARNVFPTDKTSVVDHALVAGLLSICLIMLFGGGEIIQDVGSARYCQWLMPVTAWLFCRYCITGETRKYVTGFAVVLFAASLFAWPGKFAEHAARNEKLAASTKEIGKLSGYDGVIFAEYWDAYSLLFLSGESVPLESIPGDTVRRFGAFSESAIRKRNAWLIPESKFESLARGLISLYGRADCVVSELTLMNERYLLVEFANADFSYHQMMVVYPAYFTTKYPPGTW